MPPEALLAIRSDIAAAVEQEYLEWLTREHTHERVGIEGFVSARIFRSKHPGFGRYLILYELADASVVDSPAYLERLNNPTPWTTRMMPHLGNFIRGGGNVFPTMGTGYGSCLVPIMAEAKIAAQEIQGLDNVSKTSGVVAIRALQTDPRRTTAASNERKLRSGDQSFETLLMIETFDEEAAQQVTRQLPLELQHSVKLASASREAAVYSLIFHLNS